MALPDEIDDAFEFSAILVHVYVKVILRNNKSIFFAGSTI